MSDKGNEFGLNTSLYQMEQIRDSLLQGLDVSTFANLEYNWRKMRPIIYAIQEGINISLRMNRDS